MTLLVKPPETLLETLVVTTAEMSHETSFEQPKTEKLVSHLHLLAVKPRIIVENEMILSKEAFAVTVLSKNALIVKKT